MTTIAEQALIVQGLRADFEAKKLEIKAKLEAFEAEHKAEIDAEIVAGTLVKFHEEELRRLTIEAFALNPDNKKPGPGVGIQERTTVSYEHGTALAWALDKRLFLSLDKAKFDQFAKAAPDAVPFVTVGSEVVATIAQDLAAALFRRERRRNDLSADSEADRRHPQRCR